MRRTHSGFTLIELLVAIGVMAVMAALSWRSLDGMLRTQAQVQAHSDATLGVQTGLAQWVSDLDALADIPPAPSLDWDGRALRLTRHSSTAPAQGLLVVAWSWRNVDGRPVWLRWQSPPVRTRGQWQSAWDKAAQWAQNPSEDDKRLEVAVMPLSDWQIFYFRNDAWTNPLSSDGVSAMGSNNPGNAAVPDGIRLVLTPAPGQPLSGTLTRDWIRPNLSGSKS